MSVHWLCPQLPLTEKEVDSLWRTTISLKKSPDQEVSINCVSIDQMKELNMTYRKQDTPTNVLTFSYGEGTHDVALCLDIAEQEAQAQGATLKDYTALLVVHAFLHSLGMDHERSQEEDDATRTAQEDILKSHGFVPTSLAHHS